ncbi:MAG: trimethylamine methyltransferase family protein [Chloroflexota bacterium]|nr:trimethylamine methyltransferase family protein [Chloroflexota bacterium]
MDSHAPKQVPSHPARSPRYDRLTPADCVRLHDASLSILERTGVRLHDEEAVERLAGAGARVGDDGRVFVPGSLVKWALSVAPRSVTLHRRGGEPAIALEGDSAWFGPGSDCLNILDHRTGERRRPTLQDVRDGLTMVDALPNMDFGMSMFLPSDVAPAMADRHQMAIMLECTTKPLVVVTYDLDAMLDAIEMAEAVAGGRDALRERPNVAFYINVTRGLVHNGDSLRKLLVLAERGLPALWIPVTSGGTTGPVSVAGNVVLNNAGILVGVVLAQLVREGTPVVIPGFGGDALDLRTMVDPYAGPDHRGVVPSLAHHYGLPMFSLAGGSDSKTVDQQAAAEASLTMLVDALAGGHLIHDSGYLESGLTGSLAQLAICNEIATWTRAAISPVDMSDEALALDLIDQLGPDGSFLETDHTIAHYRERWYPSLIDHLAYSAWQARGATTLAERAAVRVDRILADHRPAPLPDDVARTIAGILERAAATLRPATQA